MRLRLKADGRIVELRDGQEFPLAPAMPVAPVDAAPADVTPPAVRDLRRRAQLTQTEFAAKLGVPVETIRNWELRGRSCARLVEQALRLGYRHVDTAQVYENEREVGDGLRASGVRREEVFITTKVWTSHFAPHD